MRQSGRQGASDDGDSSCTGGSLQKSPTEKKKMKKPTGYHPCGICNFGKFGRRAVTQTDKQVPSPSWLAAGGGGGGGGAGSSEASLGIAGSRSSSGRGGGGDGEGRLPSSSTETQRGGHKRVTQRSLRGH